MNRKYNIVVLHPDDAGVTFVSKIELTEDYTIYSSLTTDARFAERFTSETIGNALKLVRSDLKVSSGYTIKSLEI